MYFLESVKSGMSHRAPNVTFVNKKSNIYDSRHLTKKLFPGVADNKCINQMIQYKILKRYWILPTPQQNT